MRTKDLEEVIGLADNSTDLNEDASTVWSDEWLDLIDDFIRIV